MAMSIAEGARNMVDDLVAGALDKIAELYAFPAAVYVGENVMVLSDEAELIGALSAYRAILTKRDLHRIDTCVTNDPDTTKDRFKLNVENTYYAKTGRVIGRARIRYYLARKEGCAKIRMVEYTEWPCPVDIVSSDVLRSHAGEAFAPQNLGLATKTPSVTRFM